MGVTSKERGKLVIAVIRETVVLMSKMVAQMSTSEARSMTSLDSAQ